MNEPLRVLLVSPAPRAGTTQYSHNLAAHLGRRGHRIAVLTSVGYELTPYARDYTVIEAIDGVRPRPLRWRTLWGALRELRPQIVHYQGGQHPELLLLLDLLLRSVTPARTARAVYTPQDLASNNRRPYHDWATRRLWARMDHLFLNSQQNLVEAREKLRLGIRAATVVPIPDLLDFVRHDVRAEPPNVPADRKLVLCFGLIEPRKGIPTLLAAFPDVVMRVPAAHLAIVGKPLMDMATLREQLARQGLQDRVTLVPDYVSFERMSGWFERADVVVLTYESGWNSGIIPVAFGYGKPVVATTVAGTAEVVRDGRTGMLIPPADPQRLADALSTLLADDALRASMRPHIAQAAAGLGWRPLVEATEAVYREVLERRVVLDFVKPQPPPRKWDTP